MMSMLAPALLLVIWTCVMWFWLYATRLPAIRKHGIQPGKFKTKDHLSDLPLSVRQVADNYNHLHEQPVLFYFLVLLSHGYGLSDGLNVALAWGYLGMRVLHSLIQVTTNFVPLRFTVFALGSFLLMGIAVRNLLAVI